MASSWGGQSWPPASLTPLSSRSSRLKAARAAFFVVVLLSGCARSPSSQTARFVSRGQSLMANKDYARAILEFRNAARLAPKDPEPSYRLGQAYLDSGDYRAGVASLLHAVELDPEHAGAQLKIAEVTSGAGAEEFGGAVWELAEKRLRTILVAWGEAEARPPGSGLPDQSSELERLASRDPQDRVVKSRLFRAYMVERRFPEAERLIDSMMEQTRARQKRAERISLLKKLLKRVFSQNGEKASDEEAQNQPDQERPADPDVLQVDTNAELERQRQNLENAGGLAQRAHLYLATARAKEAEQDLLRALKLNPSDGLAHYLMSVVHQVHSSEHARREELARSVECDPNWLAARLELARARTQSGDAYAALATLEQAPKAQQSDLAFIVERNRALLELDDRRALRESLNQALAVAKTPTFLLQEGILQSRMNDLTDARKLLDITALNARSESYLAGNQPDLALSTMRQHVSRYPEFERPALFALDLAHPIPSARRRDSGVQSRHRGAPRLFAGDGKAARSGDRVWQHQRRAPNHRFDRRRPGREGSGRACSWRIRRTPWREHEVRHRPLSECPQ